MGLGILKTISMAFMKGRFYGRLYWPREMQEEELSVLLPQGEEIMSVSQICQYKGHNACVLRGCECSCHKDRG